MGRGINQNASVPAWNIQITAYRTYTIARLFVLIPISMTCVTNASFIIVNGLEYREIATNIANAPARNPKPIRTIDLENTKLTIERERLKNVKNMKKLKSNISPSVS